jgi:hypothetical protein
VAKKGQGAGTPATVLLSTRKVPHLLHAYEHDPRARDRGLAYGMEAALALGLDPRQVFKTLVVEVDGALTVSCGSTPWPGWWTRPSPKSPAWTLRHGRTRRWDCRPSCPSRTATRC